MKRCAQCNRVLIKSTPSSLCQKCIERNRAEEKQKAEVFILDFSKHINLALEHDTILPQWGSARIKKQLDECNYVLAHIDDWRDFSGFRDAFFSTLKTERLFKTSPLFPRNSISEYSPPDFESLFLGLKKSVSRVAAACQSAESRAYDYSELFKVVGVTFKNGRRSRQTILRQIRFKDPPYNRYVELRLEKYLYEGEDAFAVYANEEQVGNISKNDVPWLLEHWPDYFCVSDFDVCGGAGGNYGLDIRVCFRNSSEVC